jgi:hypothetical protein
VLLQVRGLPIAMHFSPGQTADISAASAILALAKLRRRDLLGDKGDDTDDLRAMLCLQGAHLIILRKSNCKHPGTLNQMQYTKCNCIERRLGFAVEFRCVVTIYEKTAASLLSGDPFI